MKTTTKLEEITHAAEGTAAAEITAEDDESTGA